MIYDEEMASCLYINQIIKKERKLKTIFIYEIDVFEEENIL